MASSSSSKVSPAAMLASVIANRSLILTLARRDIAGRYRGSALGIVWSVLTPILMLLVYSFVFGEVFKQTVQGGTGSKSEFALHLFAALLVFNMFAECLNRAPSLILGNANYVKKVVFPLEVLPVVALGSAIFHMAISVAVWLLFYVVAIGVPHLASLWLPVILLPLLLVSLGVSWLLAALGVYVRDVSQMVGVLVMVLMFLSPIFYQVEALDDALRPLIYLSPVTVSIQQVRDVLFWGRAPEMPALLISTAVFALVAWLGFVFFQKTRRGFADVL